MTTSCSPTASTALTATNNMIVSTKGRYALRVMVCFALHGGDGYIPLKQIAEEENISQKYLESREDYVAYSFTFLEAEKESIWP